MNFVALGLKIYPQKEIEQLERDEGTIYVWRYVYHKDSSEYNYLQRAEEICGYKVNDIHDKEKVNQFNDILYGVNNQNEIWHQTNGINYSDGKMDKIPCQSTYFEGEFEGWSGCVSTSIAAMFRINDNAEGSASELVKCNDNGTYPKYGRNGYSFNKYGQTPNGLGIKQDEALKLIKTSLSNGDVCCVKLDKGTTDGHTVVCSGVREGVSLEDATWEDLLFNDVGRGDEASRTARTMDQMSYTNSSGVVNYSAPKDGNCCVIIDATR